MKTLAYWIILCSLTVSAHAVDPGGYWTLFGGRTEARDSHSILEDSTTPPMVQTSYRLTFADGWDGGVAFGRRYEQHFRFEFEFAGQYHKLDDLVALDAAQPSDSPEGYLWSAAGSVNSFVDLYHCCPYFIPFLGGGGGITYLRGKDDNLTDAIGAGGNTHGDYGWHWQLFAGVTVLEDPCRRGFIRYRYKEIYPDLMFNLRGGYQLRTHWRSHALEAGISFTYY